MNQWTWIEESVVWAVHEAQLAEHGGSAGVRDPGLLASALGRPLNLAAYDVEADAAALAATYGFGIARNHPFIDGNKRTAFVCAELFLALNGYQLQAEDANCVSTMLALAAGEISEAEFAAWLRTHSTTS
jgi:death-on-curing protein